MYWLRSRSCQVFPPSSDRKSALRGDSISAYTTLGFEGAMVTATRPQGFGGRPLALVWSSSVQVTPPSVEVKSPLPLGAGGPSPPERKVQPLRRKPHMPAKRTWGSAELMDIMEQPVERFAPFRILFQDLPPSVVLYTPRSSESLQSFPGTQAETVLPFFGSMR